MDDANFELIREKAASDTKSRNRVCAIGCTGIFVLFLILALIFIPKSHSKFFTLFIMIPPMMFAMCIFLVVVFLAHPAKNSLGQYHVAYKSYMIYKSLASVFPNLRYYPTQGMPAETVRTIMTTGDRYHSNDFVTATYKDINFMQADVHTEERCESQDSDGHTTVTYSTIFKGRFLVFDFKRDFSFRLQLIGKRFQGAHLAYSFDNKTKFKKIETESTEFNKQFRIYAQDGLEAFYILDPSFIEKIQEIGELYRNNILFAFIDKKLFVAINDGNDSFEAPHPAKLIDKNAEKARVSKDIETIIQCVDKLSLNRYVFEGKKK